MLGRISAITQAFGIGLLSLAGVLLLVYSAAARFAESPAVLAARTVPFTIPVGATASDIAQGLRDESLIRSDLLFQLLVEQRGLEGSFRHGTFLLRSDMTLDEIVGTLSTSTAVDQTLTFPEGWRLEQMAERMANQSEIDDLEFIRLAREGVATFAVEFDFLASLPSGQSMEGYLFPDTYQIDGSSNARNLILRMLRRFDEVVTPEIRADAADNGLSVHEMITLASIIEREAVLDEERAVISGVFHNRLARGIPLQADPTAQYAIGQTSPGARWWKPDIDGNDLRTQSPYNTYVVDGLPPGPIAAPGLASIIAAARPEATPYLFFVARGDGSHAFSETLEEHTRNIERYLN
jgi:UPF0755 protein